MIYWFFFVSYYWLFSCSSAADCLNPEPIVCNDGQTSVISPAPECKRYCQLTGCNVYVDPKLTLPCENGAFLTQHSAPNCQYYCACPEPPAMNCPSGSSLLPLPYPDCSYHCQKTGCNTKPISCTTGYPQQKDDCSYECVCNSPEPIICDSGFSAFQAPYPDCSTSCQKPGCNKENTLKCDAGAGFSQSDAPDCAWSCICMNEPKGGSCSSGLSMIRMSYPDCEWHCQKPGCNVKSTVSCSTGFPQQKDDCSYECVCGASEPSLTPCDSGLSRVQAPYPDCSTSCQKPGCNTKNTMTCNSGAAFSQSDAPQCTWSCKCMNEPSTTCGSGLTLVQMAYPDCGWHCQKPGCNIKSTLSCSNTRQKDDCSYECVCGASEPSLYVCASGFSMIQAPYPDCSQSCQKPGCNHKNTLTCNSGAGFAQSDSPECKWSCICMNEPQSTTCPSGLSIVQMPYPDCDWQCQKPGCNVKPTLSCSNGSPQQKDDCSYECICSYEPTLEVCTYGFSKVEAPYPDCSTSCQKPGCNTKNTLTCNSGAGVSQADAPDCGWSCVCMSEPIQCPADKQPTRNAYPDCQWRCPAPTSCAELPSPEPAFCEGATWIDFPKCAYKCPTPAKIGYTNNLNVKYEPDLNRYNNYNNYNNGGWSFLILNGLVSVVTSLFIIAVALSCVYVLGNKWKAKSYEIVQNQDFNDQI